MRMLAEKTDLGRVAGPSLLRLVDDALSISGNSSNLSGRTSSEIWDYLERVLEVDIVSRHYLLGQTLVDLSDTI